MKSLPIFLIIACLMTAMQAQIPLFCYAEESTLPYYAEIVDGCVLYGDENLSAPVTTLPKTYFVSVIAENETSLNVSYKSLIGYVARTSVRKVDFVPRYKYADARLTLANDGGTINVRAHPNNSHDNVVARLSDGATLEYFGTADGSILNDVIGPTWYCVALGDGKVGYVYSMYASVPPLPDNVIEPMPPPELPEVTQSKITSGKGEYFFIAALCLPVIIFMYLLFKSEDRAAEKSERR